MRLAKVIGNLVLSYSYPTLQGKKILIVEELDENLNPTGKKYFALDSISAGTDEIVLLVSGGLEAGLMFEEDLVPSDATAVAIVQEVS